LRDSNTNTGESAVRSPLSLPKVTSHTPGMHVHSSMLSRYARTAFQLSPYSHNRMCAQISRNRLGINDKAHEVAKEDARQERERAEKIKAGKKKSGAP
jgi:hypothetical protein